MKKITLAIGGLLAWISSIFIAIALMASPRMEPISKETLKVASHKCAYNGETLLPIHQHPFNGIGNVQHITTRSIFSRYTTIRCDNGAEFRFIADWRDSLTKDIPTDRIVAPEK